MSPQTQLLFARLGGVALILVAYVLNATVLKGTGAEGMITTLAGTVFGWLGLGNPIKEAVLKDELKQLSIAPPAPSAEDGARIREAMQRADDAHGRKS